MEKIKSKSNWRLRNKTSWSFKSFKTKGKKEDIKPIEGIFRKKTRTNEIKNETYEIKKLEVKIKWEDLIHIFIYI